MKDAAHPPVHLTRLTPQAHPGLWLAVGVYLLCALSYFFIVPIFEAPDEWTHTGHVKYIAEGNGLPVMLPGQGIWGGQQPPLYYAIGALLVQPFELESFDGYSERTRNPHASVGYALDPGNKNNYLHNPNETFPYRGLSLTVHLLRLYSITFGLIALIFTYLTALELAHHHRPLLNPPISQSPNLQSPISNSPTSQPPNLQSPVSSLQSPISQSLIINYQLSITNYQLPALTALFVACHPMFAFITASVANEPANIAFCAIGLWLAQRYILYGPTPRLHRAVALGIVLGLISLSKMTGLSFGLVAVVAILITAVATRKQLGAAKLLWRDGLIIGLLFGLVGGWWYWRNFQLYGDFFQSNLYKLYFDVEPQPLSLSSFLYTLSTGEVSFWATFGWLNIVGPEWLYTFYRLLPRVGLTGLTMTAVLILMNYERGIMNYEAKTSTTALPTIPQPPIPQSPNLQSPNLQSPISNLLLALIPHLLFPLTLAFSLARLVSIEGGIQGRQILPALGSIAIVTIWGWWLISPPRLRLPVVGTLIAVMAGLAVWLPYGVVAREYTPPPLIAEADLPADLTRLDWTFNNEMKLIAAKIEAEVVRPGERVPVTVYWQALQPMTTDYSVFVHLIGRKYESVGQLNTYPSLGLRPTTTLQPGQIVVDTYPVLVNGGAAAPTRLLVNVGLFNINEAGRPGIPAIDPTGQEVEPTVGQLKLIPTDWPEAPSPPLAEFADNIQLAAADLQNCHNSSSDCTLTFTWLAQAQPSTDYTIFIQLWQGDQQIDGFDGPPLNSDYPTRLWAAQEVIIDPHSLDLADLPPGTYRLLAGLYDFQNDVRLPAFKDGEPLHDYAVEVGEIEWEGR